jgi:hypothetical protein
MHRLRNLLSLLVLSLFAVPVLAAEIVTLTIDADSPRPLGTGLVAESGDRFLVLAEGAAKLPQWGPVTDGWFDPSGLGRLRRVGQILPDSHYGVLMGTFSVPTNSFMIGDIASWTTATNDIGDELMLILNMDDDDQASMQGAFKVHVVRYTESESVSESFVIDASSTNPVATGIFATDPDQIFLVVGQGAARLTSYGPTTDGWFDASGLGRLRRVGQIILDEPYGGLLGSFGPSLDNAFFVGDVASWRTQGADLDDELLLGLNMDADDLAAMSGSIVAHVLRVDGLTVTSAIEGETPDRDAILSVDTYPNPFNPMTTIRFQLAGRQMVRASIVNVAGEVVRTLAHGTFGPGQHELSWNGRDDAGRGQASGTYLLRLETDRGAQTRKLALIR